MINYIVVRLYCRSLLTEQSQLQYDPKLTVSHSSRTRRAHFICSIYEQMDIVLTYGESLYHLLLKLNLMFSFKSRAF